MWNQVNTFTSSELHPSLCKGPGCPWFGGALARSAWQIQPGAARLSRPSCRNDSTWRWWQRASRTTSWRASAAAQLWSDRCVIYLYRSDKIYYTIKGRASPCLPASCSWILSISMGVVITTWHMPAPHPANISLNTVRLFLLTQTDRYSEHKRKINGLLFF